MGQDTTISLLTQMNGTLKGILNAMTPKNETDTNREITQKIHSGNTFNPEQSAPQNQVTLKGNLSVDDIVKAISSLPAAVKDIARLKNKDIDAFTDVLVSIAESLKDFSEGTKDIGDFKALDILSKSLSSLSQTKFKGTLKEFVAIDKMHVIDHMLNVTKGLAKVSREAKKINVGDLKKLQNASVGLNAMKAITTSMLAVVGSVLVLATAMKFIDGDGGNNILKSVGVIALIMTGITALAIGVGIASKFIKPTNLTPIVTFILAMQGLVLTTLLLGMVAQNSWSEIVKGFGITAGVMLGYVFLASLCSLVSKKAMESAPSIGTILGYSAIAMGLVLASLLLGKVANEAYEEIIIGFAATSGIILGYSLVMSKAIAVGKFETAAVKNMASVMAIAYAASGLVLVSKKLGDLAIDSYKEIALGFMLTTGVITLYGGLISYLSKRFNIVEMTKATNTIRQIGMIGVEALALVGGAILLSKFIEDSDLASVTVTVGLTIGLMFALTSIAKTASKVEKDVKKGIKSLVPLELLAAGALGIVFAATKVAEKAEEVGMGKVTGILLESIGLVGAFGALAYAAGKINTSTILKGAAVLGLIDLVAFGMTKVVGEMADITKQVHELGQEPWKEMLKTLGGMTAVVGAFGTLAAVCGLGPVPLILAAGAAALGTVELVALGAVSVIKKTLEAANLIDENVYEKIDSVTGSFSYVVDSLFNMLGVKFALKMAAITAATPLMVAVAGSMFSISSTLSQIALVAGTDGKLRPAKFMDDGTVAYGEFADIKAATVTITDSMTYFVEELYDTFSKLKLSELIKTAIGMKVIGMVMDPVSKFADTMLSFQEGGTEGTIHAITFDNEGNVKAGPDVNVALVAKAIGNSITTFVETLFNDDNMELWSNMISGSSFVMTHSGFLGLQTKMEAVPGTAQQAMGILSMVLEPVSNFAKTLTMFSGADGTTLSIPVYDSNGVLKTTRTVDVAAASRAIASAITAFVSGITSNASTWYNLIYGAGTTTTGKGKNAEVTSNMQSAVGIFAAILTPVVTFTDMISKFVTKDGKLLAVNSRGETHEVDFIDTATRISSCIDTFVRSITTSFNANMESIDSISKNSESIQKVLSGIPTMFTNLVKDMDTESLTSLTTSLTTFADNIGSIFKVLNDMDAFNAFSTNIQTLPDTFNKLSVSIDTKNLKQISTSLKDFMTDMDTIGSSIDLTKLTSTGAAISIITANVKLLNAIGTISQGSQRTLKTIPNIFKGIEKGIDPAKVSQIGNSMVVFASGMKEISLVPFENIRIDMSNYSYTALTDVPRVTDTYAKATDSTKKLSASLLKFKQALEDVDDALEKGQSKRLKNLDDINERYSTMSDNAFKLSKNLEMVKKIMDELKAYDQNDFDEVTNVINSIKVEGMLTRDDVIEAIRQTFDDATISSQGRGYVLDLD